MLNRKPTTLAQRLNPEAWRNIADCAYARHRAAADRQEWRACDGESATSSMAFAQARLARDPFPIVVADGLRHYGAVPTIDSLAIDREHHIKEAINAKPLTVPDYVDNALSDDATGWRETVCAYLRAIDDENREHDWRNFSLSGDLSGEIDFTVITPVNASDVLWCNDTFIVVDGLLYKVDGTLAESGLYDDRIGWYVSDIAGNYLADCESQTQRYATGYACSPTNELAADLLGDPVWHHGLNCFIGRLKFWPHPVRLHPDLPAYGG